MIIKFTVDGRDTDIESTHVTGMRRDSESSTTLIMDDDTLVHVTEPFNSVHDKLILADEEYW